MICSQCGKKNPDGSKFCANCGNSIVPGAARRGGNGGVRSGKKTAPGKLVYESRGISPRRKAIVVVCGLLLVIVGIVFIAIANHKRSGTMVYVGYSSGSIGGGYMLEEGARKTLTIVGVIISALGVGYMLDLIALKKNSFRVFTDHIEGCSVAVFIFVIKKEFYLEYNQIRDVQMTHSGGGSVQLRIMASGDRYGAELFRQGEAVYKYIRGNVYSG